MEKIFVVKRVAEQLWATEDAIDGAIAEASKLMGGLVEARKELKLSAIVTDESHTKIAEAMNALVEARAAMVAAHHTLNEAKLRIGVRTKMDGGKPVVLTAEPIERAEVRRTA